MAKRVSNTKHFRVSQLLNDQIRALAPGEMIPTVSELKDKYQSSQATITQALDRLRLQGLIERPAGKKRLVVARIAPRTTFHVTLIRPIWSSPDYDGITNSIYEMGHQEHFGFGVYIYSDIKSLNIEHALKNSDAGLVIGDLNMTPEQVEAVNSARKPIVFLRNKPTSVRAGSVWVDDGAVGEIATNHLLELGHRQIAVMLSEPYNPSSFGRMQGWLKTLNKAGVGDIETLIADCSVEPGHEAMAGSYERFSRWLDSKCCNFTALFCVGWTGALASLRALREHGIRVPEDVSVITYASEMPLCNFTAPPLTTVEIDLKAYTREALRLVQKNLAGAEPVVAQQEIRLAPHLVVRGSSAKPRKAEGRGGRVA